MVPLYLGCNYARLPENGGLTVRTSLPQAATRRSVMLLVVAAAAVTPLLARFMGLNVASLLSALVCALAMAAGAAGNHACPDQC